MGDRLRDPRLPANQRLTDATPQREKLSTGISLDGLARFACQCTDFPPGASQHKVVLPVAGTSCLALLLTRAAFRVRTVQLTHDIHRLGTNAAIQLMLLFV